MKISYCMQEGGTNYLGKDKLNLILYSDTVVNRFNYIFNIFNKLKEKKNKMR